jgi:hypothetical protein
MKLKQKIKVSPPPYSNHSGEVIHPPVIETDILQLAFVDDENNKQLKVEIQDFPSPITLYSGDAYGQLGDWKKSQLEARLEAVLGDDPSTVLRNLFPKTMEEEPNGPGTQLSKMIKSLGIHMSDSCSCRRHAIEMNSKGNDWCEENIDTVVGWLEQEAKNRGLPFVKMVGKVMVNRAIKKSRKLLANEPVPENDEDLDNE